MAGYYQSMEGLGQGLSHGRRLSAQEREERELAFDAKEIAVAERTIAKQGHDYPLYVCLHCHRIDGWLDKDGYICLHCLSVYPFFRRVESPLIYQPRLGSLFLGRLGSWRLARDLDRFSSKRPPLWSRALKLVGYRRPYQLRALRNWQRFVSGWPEQPPLGTEIALWGAEKFETLSPSGDERLVVFKCGWYWWRDGRFERRKQGPDESRPLNTGSVFPASLPIEQLVSAWHDFQQAVDRENVDDWRQDEHSRLQSADRRALEAEQASLQQEDLKSQQGVVDLF